MIRLTLSSNLTEICEIFLKVEVLQAVSKFSSSSAALLRQVFRIRAFPFKPLDL